MRKTSQDGGDNTSIASGVENEIKKPIVGIMKTKRNSLKRKVQNFSHESDDAVVEPLLQKEKSEIPNQSAKHSLPKIKTESSSDVVSDRDKLLSDDRVEKPSLSNAPSIVGNTSIPNGTKEVMNHLPRIYESSDTIHNHMNTNIFNSLDSAKKTVVPKSQILVEIDSNKSNSYNPSPLIFTTAKIHTDGKIRHMEPVQVTPVPILSTIEGSVKACMDKTLPVLTTEGNDVVSTSIKLSNIESKITKDNQTTKSAIVNTFAPCILSNNTSIDKKHDTDLNKIIISTLANNSIKPLVTVDMPINIVNTSNATGVNSGTKVLFDSKKLPLNMESNGSLRTKERGADVNKNFETKIILQDRSSDGDINVIKEMPAQKNAIDFNTSARNVESNNQKQMTEKEIMEPKKVETTSKLSFSKENENTSSTASNIFEKRLEATITPQSNTTSSILNKSVPLVALPAKNTNIVPMVKPEVLNKMLVSESAITTEACNKIKKSFDASTERLEITAANVTPESTSISKPTDVKKIPITASSTKTDIAKTFPSQQVSVSSTFMSAADANTVSTNKKTIKPSELMTANVKSNNLTKTIVTSVEPQSNKKPQTTTVSTSSSVASNSLISTAKAQGSSIRTSKPTASGSKSSTSVIISKPNTASLTSNLAKQMPKKPSTTKSSNTTVSSVKTLITSSDKPSHSGSIKPISSKSLSKQNESKVSESKKV
ncbi:mucin-3A isoform X1 [Amyelois transitella]|uniref:mucin-3A isoform X1 n=1 Tax=Amyelois transitella TaxID=680683 RepID=UPI0029906DAF|nr:mucin-3A isoform X1 [Amyelois transitella]